MLIALLAVALFSVYSYYRMQKMMRKNKPKANQLDGTIVDEGQSFSDIAGSPHMYGFITWIGDKNTAEIKKKQGKK